MGTCSSKKSNKNFSENLIIENSNDKYINCFKGQLYINSIKCKNVEIYLYEDYLYIKKNDYNLKISYYHILNWSFDKQKYIFRFSTKINNIINIYNIIIFDNQNNKNISDELLDIINAHIKHVKNIIE